MIRQMTKKDAGKMARIHQVALKDTFLSSLGIGFLKGVYCALADDPKGVLFVAEKSEEVVGAVTCVLDCDTFLKRTILKSPIRLFTHAGLQVMKKPSVLKKMFQTLRYGNMGFVKGVNTELLDIMVVPKFQGKGIGSSLLNTLLKELKSRKVKKLKVLVGQELEGAQRFYKKHHFIAQKTITLYGKKKHILVRDI